MKNGLGCLLFLPCLTAWGAPQKDVLNSLPDGYAFREVRFVYDEQACGGPMNFALNPKNGDCTVEFNDFYALQTSEKICKLRIEVDLPPGLSMTPSRLTIEGDYQFNDGGMVNLSAHYSMEGSADTITLERHWSNTDAGVVSNSFLEEEMSGPDTMFSPCGGTAVFQGDFIVRAGSSIEGGQSLIDIGKTNVGAGSEKKAPISYWGWNYKLCDDQGSETP